MPNEEPSEFNQESFIGGMSLLGDDSRLQPNQYRIGFNLTNRDDELDPVLVSSEDFAIPFGNVQELVTFGNYLILFISGSAYYRFYTDVRWVQIANFRMDTSAQRYWTCAIPVSTTNYIRLAATGLLNTGTSNPAGGVQLSSVEGASAGNLPGLLVQDNINQPYFIFLDVNNIPTARVTQNFVQWFVTYTDDGNTSVALDGSNNPIDNREYVPIGNSMTWNNGVLYLASKDGNFIYRSVSGRPLDFVVNVSNLLAKNVDPFTNTYTDPITGRVYNTTYQPFTQIGGGDATTTSYSVGVGGITCLRPMSSGGIFVSASGANFNVTQNMTQNSPTEFGEYTFNRAFLFNAVCLSDRGIFDSLGDTRFIDLTGVRSFNAIESLQNEGRNSPFTKNIQAAFNGITQDATLSAGILYDNYELYAMQTLFGPAIAKYDTINNCWTSFDTTQVNGKNIKILAKIELSVQRLFAVTEDNKLYTLYLGPEDAIASVRTIGVCANILYENQNIKMNDPKNEVRLNSFRVILNKITEDGNISFTPYVNNRLTPSSTLTKSIVYDSPITISTNSTDLPDVNTQLNNILFTSINSTQGWKVFGLLSWSVGVVTQYSFELSNNTPVNPINSQATVDYNGVSE